MFCGAGGSSQGIRRLAERMNGGIEVKLAMNHWKLAIETHNTNFPDTMHDCTDISACDPRRYPGSDIAIMSPECTTHSPAGGNNHKTLKKQMEMFNTLKIDPATERSRATMWDVCRFAEYHQYNAIIVENVVEAKTRWVLFDAWLNAMHNLGYDHKCVYLNSMHCHPTPQSRDRMYIVFWKKGNKAPDLEHRPLAWCPCCEKNVNAVQVWKNPEKKFGKYRSQYLYRCPKDGIIVEPYYYAAFNIIDWSNLGTRIGDRKSALSDNTIKRINYGLDKYGSKPMVITTKYHSESHEFGSKLLSEPLRTQCGEQAHGIFSPFLIDDKQSTGIGYRARAITGTTNTICCDHRLKLIIPHIIEMNKTGECKPANYAASTITAGGINHAVLNAPFIVKGEHTTLKGYCKSVDSPIQTQTVRQTMSLITPPIITTNRGQSMAHSSLEPITTQSSMINHGIVTNEAMKSFLMYNNNGVQVSHITDPSGTQATGERMSVVNYQKPNLEDCYYRMLNKHEVKLSMAFDPDYIILGSGKDQVKQCGNAVTPPAMEWLAGQVVESLS